MSTTIDHTKMMAGIGGMLPDVFAAFDAQTLTAVYINPAGLRLLDPRSTATLEKLTLLGLVGVNDTDRFHREIFPQTRVLGAWTGPMVLRDMLGCEFACNVKLRDTPGDRKTGGRWLYLHATLAAAGAPGESAASDPDMLNALLETSPDCIYFKDAASRFLRISLTHAKKFGLESPRDAIGKTDFDFFGAEHASPAFEDEQRIIKTNTPVVDIEEKETFEDGSVVWVSTTKLPFYGREGKLIGTYGISRDITKRKLEAERLQMLSRAVSQSPTSIIITDTQGRIEYVNPYFEKISGFSAAEAVGQNPRILKSGRQAPELYKEMWATISNGDEWNGEIQNCRKDGEAFWERASISAMRNEQGEITHYIAVKEDITELKRAEVDRRELENRLLLAQKLESVGMLAAGVAHEINTPTQYITDNTRFLTDSFAQLVKVLASYRALIAQAAAHQDCEPALQEVAAAQTENELEYLLTEIPRTLEQSLEGLGRISRIVGSLKEFSHPNMLEKSGANLNKAIETTMAVSRHEWKYVADVVTELDPEMPEVICILDEFNQAVLNLIINAAHSIGDAIKQRGLKRGTITIRTRQEPGWAVVEVEDTGTGIPPEIAEKIFDPFFTTKGIGKGTGQGLAIVQAVIVKGHGGLIDFKTEVGKGTTFQLRLPLAETRASRTSLSAAPTP